VEGNGATQHLALNDFRIEVLDRWKSPKSGANYPMKWKVRIPAEDIELVITPAFPEQELITNRSTRVTQSGGVLREFSFKVLGTETINTPAGPFGTFKVEETSYELDCRFGNCHTPDDTLTVRHLWYAPAAKFIVKVAEVRGRYTAEQEPDYELIAFDLK
jgi:hypothetical protein